MVGIAMRALITLVVVVYLYETVPWTELKVQLSRANYYDAVLAGIVYFVIINVLSLRWWILLKIQKIECPLSKVMRVNWISFFFNLFLLGSNGGDIIKLYYIIKEAPDKKATASLTVVTDRLLGLFTLLVLLTFFSVFYLPTIAASAEMQGVLLFAMLLIFLFLAGGFAMLFFPLEWIPRWIVGAVKRVPHWDHLEEALGSMREHRYHWKYMSAVVLIAVAGHLLNFFAGVLIAGSLGVETTLGQMAVIMGITFCVISLPVSFGGIGVREAVFAQMFLIFGLGGETVGVAFSIIYFMIVLWWGMVGGAVYMLHHHQAKRNLSMIR